MIPVKKSPEPADFDQKVRTPGSQFLARVTKPATKDWKGNEHWRQALPELREEFSGVCGYCVLWIPRVAHTVDHYLCRSAHPELAYEWSNFRYATSLMNTRKGSYSDVLDPCNIPLNMFVLDFPSLLLKPAGDLMPELRKQANETIARLKLNADDYCVQERAERLDDYCRGEISFDHLRRMAPFIASELERLGKVESIRSEFKYPLHANEYLPKSES